MDTNLQGRGSARAGATTDTETPATPFMPVPTDMAFHVRMALMYHTAALERKVRFEALTHA